MIEDKLSAINAQKGYAVRSISIDEAVSVTGLTKSDIRRKIANGAYSAFVNGVGKQYIKVNSLRADSKAEYLTVDAAATILNTSHSFITRRCQSGAYVAEKRGRRWYVRMDSLIKDMSKHDIPESSSLTVVTATEQPAVTTNSESRSVVSPVSIPDIVSTSGAILSSRATGDEKNGHWLEQWENIKRAQYEAGARQSLSDAKTFSFTHKYAITMSIAIVVFLPILTFLFLLSWKILMDKVLPGLISLF
ncbi:DNA-binding protein [bacterium]|nr:DNA-binding protein [bacterium]NBT60206.1 DNA-binding protein [Planctomycetia bacterium]